MPGTDSRTGGEIAAPPPARVLPLVPELSRYTIASALALSADVILFVTLTHGLAAPASIAGAVGYAVGLALHFHLSIRFVFPTATDKSRRRLAGEFLASGLAGLAMTVAVITLATELAGAPAAIAKAVAVVTSFLAVYVLRRRLVFR